MRIGSRFIAVLASACTLAGAVSAQPAATVHIRGTIAAFDGHALTVATREGPQVAVDVPAKARISALRRVDLSSVRRQMIWDSEGGLLTEDLAHLAADVRRPGCSGASVSAGWSGA